MGIHQQRDFLDFAEVNLIYNDNLMIKKTVWHLSRRLYYFALWRFTQMRMSFRKKYKIQNRTGNTIRTNRKPKENYQKHLDWHLFQKLSRQGKQTIPYLINYDHIENNIILKILNVFWYWKPTMGGWYQSVGRIIFSQYHNFFTKNCALSNMFPPVWFTQFSNGLLFGQN